MSFTSDPAAVQALLEQLRASQAWQEAVAQQPSEPKISPLLASKTEHSEATPSVASLLSQLQTATSWPSDPSAATQSLSSNTHSHRTRDAPSTQPLGHPCPPDRPNLAPRKVAPRSDTEKEPPSSTSQNGDVKSHTFQQALPILAQLSQNQSILGTLVKLKEEQDDLERRLWDERASIQTKYEDKVKVAQTKATLIGAGLSKHEADMISTAYKRELEKFDLERALPAWDGLITSQQNALAHLGVPTMFPTTAKPARERQQRVIQVLEGLTSNSDH